MMNYELEKYNAVTAEDILKESRIIFRQENSNTLYYLFKELIMMETIIHVRQEKCTTDS